MKIDVSSRGNMIKPAAISYANFVYRNIRQRLFNKIEESFAIFAVTIDLQKIDSATSGEDQHKVSANNISLFFVVRKI